MLRQRTRKGGAGIDLGAQHSDQVVLALVVCFFRQGGQRAFQRQAGRHQPCQLARPDGQRRGIEHRPREQSAAQRAGTARRRGHTHWLHRQRHQRLRAQLAAGGLGGVGFHHALAGLAFGVEGFKGKGGHLGVER